ncbi:MAG: hypothetical protein MUF83_06590 [Acidimicrobiales bacterium]|nr:hypothetical protein [Acidimicrobiales bacterium]
MGSETDLPGGVSPPAEGAFCCWCGRSAGSCDGAACRRALDPPRFCPVCGRRLRVLVTPSGMTASCGEHGPLAE